MSDADVLEWSSLAVEIRLVDPIERVQALDHVSEHGMFPIEVIYPVRESDEELTPASRGIGGRDGHGDCPLGGVFQLIGDLRGEVAGWPSPTDLG